MTKPRKTHRGLDDIERKTILLGIIWLCSTVFTYIYKENNIVSIGTTHTDRTSSWSHPGWMDVAYVPSRMRLYTHTNID